VVPQSLKRYIRFGRAALFMINNQSLHKAEAITADIMGSTMFWHQIGASSSPIRVT
jgi:hypothetical protein